jgi:glycerol-3-phosphate dehydrogenase
VDEVCRLAGDNGGPYLQVSKGAHILVPGDGAGAGFVLLHPADGRVFFVLPWHGRKLIGTTETLGDTNADRVRATSEDIAYLLAGHNHYFAAALRAQDVIGDFAGLRPLLRSGLGDPSALTREYRLWTAPAGLLSVAGGKYTTYRAMAEAVTNEVGRRLGRHRRCRTRHWQLVGAPKGAWKEYWPAETGRLQRRYGLDATSARHLVDRYGRRAADVAVYLEGDADMKKPVVPGEPDLRAELAYQRTHEMAVQPADYWLRRTRLGLFHPALLRMPPLP